MYKELLNEREVEGFTIKIFATPEWISPDDSFDFESDEHREETLSWIESQGLNGWFCAIVEVYKADVKLAFDSLGCCSYRSTEEFLKDAYCEGMIDQALAEAKLALPTIIQKLAA